MDKKLEYLKSDEYRKYLEQIANGAKTEKDLVKQMKEIRSNNVYLNKQAKNNNKSPIKICIKSDTMHTMGKENMPEHQINQKIKLENSPSITNLSKITEKDYQPTNEKKISKNLISCEPYL